MNEFLSHRRAFLVLFSLTVLIGAYLGLRDDPSRAQDRRPEPPKARYEQYSRDDSVTAAIRDRSKELVRVEFRSIAERENISRHGTIVEDFGSSVVLIKNKKDDLARRGFIVQRIETTIDLPGARFEPIDSTPTETVRPDDPGQPARGYYVVQFGGIAIDDWLDSLRDAGVEMLQYVPHQAFFVYGDGEAITRASRHSRVRWVGRFAPEHKLSREVREFTRNGDSPTAMYDVAVFSNQDLGRIAPMIGGRVLATSKLPNNFFNVIRVELDKAELDRVAATDGVFRIDPYIPPTAEDERAAQIVAGNFSGPTTLNPPGYDPLAQFGVDGTGVTVMVSDDGISIPGNGGLYITASNTVDGPLRGAAPGATGGHGHINASIIAGSTPFGGLDSLGYNYGLGIAPKANIINIPFLVGTNTTTDAQAIDDALNTLGPNGARGTISNNSWGSGTNGNSYDSLAAQYDGFVRDGSFASTIDPFSIIFSAGNSGPSANSLTRPKVSKNTIAVANSENVRPEVLPFPAPSPSPTPIGATADNMEDLRSTSSRGPAADGRIKPDVTAPGTVITGSRAGSCGSVSGCFDANHAYSTGTSHAAPQVAGAAALFTQYYRNSHAGTSPNPSLIKAAIINSAQEMNGLTTNLMTVPNGNEGWGRISMKHMMNTGVPMYYINEEHIFSNPGTLVAYIGTVTDPSKPLRVTLVWTDPPGAGNPALVNNLDLTVNVGGSVYRGNVFANGSSTTGGSGNTVDNVENVFLPAGIPAGTVVSISISAVALNGDGVLGNTDTTDQHFSLVGYNFQPLAPDRRPPADFDGDDRTDVSVRRADIGHWWIYRSSDNAVFSTAIAAIGTPGTPVFADYTGDGKDDVAAWGDNGMWYIQRSEDFSYFAVPFGQNGDVPVPADYDGDDKADRAVFRPSAGTWFIQRSLGGVDTIPFGVSSDLPVPADYDGDGRTDLAIFRPASGQWWISRSTAGLIVLTFGTSTDRTVQGDYTGDGKADVAIWRPATGEWFVLRSEDLSYYSVPFGTAGDKPVPGDYDGDDKFDTAIFRPSSATWYVNRSTAGLHIQNFGISSDIPLPNVSVR